MKILILGAAGRTGRLLVEQALVAGHTVTAFVRSEDPAIAETPDVTTFVGDATNEADLAKALQGQDAVISTLGPIKPRDTVVSLATGLLIKVAAQQKIKRVIMMSSFLASPQFRPNAIVRFALKLMDGIVSHFKSAEELFEGSHLDYTIVYATRLTNEPLDKNYVVVQSNEAVGANDSISRANVAHFLVTQLVDTAHIAQTVLITDKK